MNPYALPTYFFIHPVENIFERNSVERIMFMLNNSNLTDYF
jgi:hypothetical protein